MPQRNIHRDVTQAKRSTAMGDTSRIRGIPDVALILVLNLLITSGGAG